MLSKQKFVSKQHIFGKDPQQVLHFAAGQQMYLRGTMWETNPFKHTIVPLSFVGFERIPHASTSTCTYAKGQKQKAEVAQWLLYLSLVRHQKRAPCLHC